MNQLIKRDVSTNIYSNELNRILQKEKKIFKHRRAFF